MNARRCVLLVLLCATTRAVASGQEPLRPYVVVGDAIPVSLTGTRGDSERGRAIVVARQNTCLLCHSGPFPEERFQGDLGPDLKGVGTRLSESEIRARIVDPARVKPDTIMPAYYKTDGLNRVATAVRGKTILSAEQIEDIVAYLVTLK